MPQVICLKILISFFSGLIALTEVLPILMFLYTFFWLKKNESNERKLFAMLRGIDIRVRNRKYLSLIFTTAILASFFLVGYALPAALRRTIMSANLATLDHFLREPGMYVNKDKMLTIENLNLSVDNLAISPTGWSVKSPVLLAKDKKLEKIIHAFECAEINFERSNRSLKLKNCNRFDLIGQRVHRNHIELQRIYYDQMKKSIQQLQNRNPLQSISSYFNNKNSASIFEAFSPRSDLLECDREMTMVDRTFFILALFLYPVAAMYLAAHKHSWIIRMFLLLSLVFILPGVSIAFRISGSKILGPESFFFWPSIGILATIIYVQVRKGRYFVHHH